jgi:hypothetical protein
METQTFGTLRASHFRDLPKIHQQAFQYIEQLASTTQTSIDSWNTSFLEGLDLTDKRALNAAFFKQAGASESKLSEEETKALEAAVQAAEKIAANLIKARVDECRSNSEYYLTQATEYYLNFARKLSEAHKQHREALACEGKAPQVREEFQKIFKNTFWKFHEVEAGSALSFITRSEIILTEKNPAAGIDRRVNFGLYRAKLNYGEARIHVLKHEKNVLSGSFYHPYVNVNGNICWGNAADAAGRAIREGRWSDVMNLLASLLTTYTPEATPYRSLFDFVRDAEQIPITGPMCRGCGNPQANCGCDRCDLCGDLRDDCVCSFCDACDVRYRGDSCGGNWCEQCEECFGTEHCDAHFCSICTTYERDTCECCTACERTDDNCERCRECDNHAGVHSAYCSRNEPAEPTEEATF